MLPHSPYQITEIHFQRLIAQSCCDLSKIRKIVRFVHLSTSAIDKTRVMRIQMVHEEFNAFFYFSRIALRVRDLATS